LEPAKSSKVFFNSDRELGFRAKAILNKYNNSTDSIRDL
jgi:hypothetical protein